MWSPRQLRQNLFLHLLNNLEYGLNYYSSQLRFTHARAGLDGRSSAAFRWVWLFLQDESVCPRLGVDLKDSGNELMPTMSAFLSPIEPAGQDISPASHVPLPWRSGEPRADTGAMGSHVTADSARTNPLSKLAAPCFRAAFCCVQSTITWLLTHSHDTSPS